MENKIELRGYRRDDLQTMFALDILCFSEAFRFDLRSMKGFAEAKNAIVLLAERSNPETHDPSVLAPRILGFVIVHIERTLDGSRGYIVTLDVSPTARRSGIAGLLMQRAETLTMDAAARRMELHVYSGNEAAIRFYERLGYNRIGVRQAFYGVDGGVSLDAYIYRKELRPE